MFEDGALRPGGHRVVSYAIVGNAKVAFNVERAGEAGQGLAAVD